jgi:hypothetical protein
MKHLKKISFFFILLVGILFYSCNKESANNKPVDKTTSEVRGTGNCQPNPNNYPSLNCVQGVFVNNILLPQYPNCYISISVPYMTCPSANSTFIEIGQISITGSGCSGVNQYVADLNAAQANGTLHQFNNAILAQIYAIITPAILALQAPIITNSLIVKYVLAQCTKTYLVEVYVGEFSYYVPVTENCGTSCCSRTDQYAFINGKWTLQSSSLQEQTENCQSGIDNTCKSNCNIWREF